MSALGEPVCETIDDPAEGWCREPARFIVEGGPDGWVKGTLICRKHDVRLRADGGSTRPIRFAGNAVKGGRASDA